jgi:transcriptional regulator with XRE-family HTH domain
MDEKSCAFGQLLVSLRQRTGISQWALAVRAEFNVTNLRKIEKGRTQPGVVLATRLVKAIGVDVGQSFLSLAEQEGLCGSAGQANLLEADDGTVNLVLPRASGKCPFGPLFKQARLSRKVSQRKAAEAAQYSLRNLFAVESGNQEPGVMTALAMVGAVGCDVAWFFNQFAGMLEEGG